MRGFRTCAVAAAGLFSFLAGPTAPAHAAGFVIAPGPEGQDVSYYSFIQTLNRGQYPTMYVHTSVDDNGFDHNAETFVRFDLPPGMLAPGETVLSATVLMVFAFTFDHGGTPPPPGGEISVAAVLEDWQEGSLNYQTQPVAGPPIQTITEVDGFGTIGFDVTETVALWAHDMVPNYGFRFSNPNSEPMGFHSFESAVDPSFKARLLIVTGPGDPPNGGPPVVPVLGVPGLLLLVSSMLAAGCVVQRRRA